MKNKSLTCQPHLTQYAILDTQYGFGVASTPVENVRQIGSFMQNEPNFPLFSPKNNDLKKKTNPNKPNFCPKTSINLRNEPKQTQ
jgi:hypothetical protein